MDTLVIDNSANDAVNKVYTWQFDNGTNLCAVIDALKEAYNKSVAEFWDAWGVNVMNLDTANDFGLSLWGKILHCERPVLTINNVIRELSREKYRKILKARAKLLDTNASVKAYCEYLNSVFDGNVKITDSRDMAVTFTVNSAYEQTDAEMYAVIQRYPDVVYIYPAGVKDNAIPNDCIFGIVENDYSGNTMITDRDENGGLTVRVGTLYNDTATVSDTNTTIPPASFKWNSNDAAIP